MEKCGKMRENADQNNSEYGHFLRSVVVAVFSLVHYDTLLQKATDITKKWDSYFISKCNKSLLQSASCFFLIKSAIVLLQDKMWHLLQNTMNLSSKSDSFTKCDIHYKMCQYKQLCIYINFITILGLLTWIFFSYVLKIIFLLLPGNLSIFWYLVIVRFTITVFNV